MTKPNPRILSIQSHVVSGYCGNKSATFPLQLLEFEVDVINSVQLSNHTQYKVTKGQIFRSQDLQELHSGLKGNNLLSLYDNIVTGYVADASYIEAMANMIEEIKSERESLGLSCWYTLDPVLGDDGTGFYVPNGTQIAEVYKKKLIPLADIITPNRFEASVLTGEEISTSADEALPQAIKAVKAFHKMGVKVVIITSLDMEDGNDELICLISHQPNDGSEVEAWILRVPKFPCMFTGTGDLFAALVTAWLRTTKFDIKKSFENTANSIHEILEDTMSWYERVGNGTVHSYELRLVQNKLAIMSPKERFSATKIDLDSLSKC